MESSSAGNSFRTPSVVFLCDSAKQSNFTTLWKFKKLAPEKLAGPQKGKDHLPTSNHHFFQGHNFFEDDMCDIYVGMFPLPLKMLARHQQDLYGCTFFT